MIKIKIIDLLNKIANGEEVPKKIKVFSFIYEYSYDDEREEYSYIYENTNTRLDNDFLLTNLLNEEVEIIEDTPKEDKKIKDKARFQYSQIPLWSDMIDIIRITNENFEKHQKALNEIIDKINKGV